MDLGKDVYTIKQSLNSGMNIHIVSVKPLDFYENEAMFVVIFGSAELNGKLVEPSSITAEKLSELIVKARFDIAAVYADLLGKFYFAVYNKKSSALTLVNDQLGVQACYYTVQQDTLFISHSLKQLQKKCSLNLSISKQAIFNYLYFHCIPAPKTIFDEVKKLEPAKAVTFTSEFSHTDELFYSPEFTQQQSLSQQDIDALKTECLTTIDAIVEHQAEPDVGAFLSGGLDSSTVAGMLAKHHQSAKTFSIGFRIDGYDETPYAELTAKHFNTEHNVLYLEADEVASEFVKVAQYFDEPFGNSSAMAAYFCAKFAKEHGVKTLLAGDGGDELFAGNERYAKQKQFEFYYKLPKLLRALANASLNNKLARSIPGVSKVSSYVRQAEIKLPGRLQTYNFINMFGVENMFTPEFLKDIDTEQPLQLMEKRYSEAKSEHFVDRMLYLDWKFTLTDNDLVKVNNMCELASVEVKYPLLDKRLIDFSCKVPAEVKLPGYKLRHFYKETCRGFLADETLDKSKHGFGLPFGLWLKENEALKSIAIDALEKFKQRGIVKSSLIDDALNAHESVHASYYGELIWIIVVLELWLQQ